MVLFTTSIWWDFVGVITALLVIICLYYYYSFKHWANKNFPYVEPKFPMGNLDNPFRAKQNPGEVVCYNWYNAAKERNLKHCGFYIFAAPIYLCLDPEYIKIFLSRDFSNFMDRGSYVNEKDDPISAHLFAITGTKWRNLRMKLTPTFTSGKMKMMFSTLVACERNLHQAIDGYRQRHEPINIKEVLACFTTDIIGSCAFGVECNTFQDKDSPFRRYGKKALDAPKLRMLLINFATLFPNLGRLLKIHALPRDVADFFTKTVTDVVEYREKNGVNRKDFLQLLIELKNNEITYEHDGKHLTMDEVVAQSFVFFLAGFETSSTTMTFALYELAKNQEIQERVREEINRVLKKYDNQITYEAIQEMKYMSQVVDVIFVICDWQHVAETLRKYPPLPLISRKCMSDYKLPDCDVIMDKDTIILIPILGIHRDPDYYPDPEKFDPERFTDEMKKTRHPYTYLPFGEGPRICIGLRFGLMQTKVGLTSILKNYKLSIDPKTKEPLKMSPNSFILTAEGDIWLDAEKI